MRKLILLYHFIIFIISIIINFVYMYDKSYSIHFLIISQIICFTGLYYTYRSLLNYKIIYLNAVRFLLGFNLLQIITFSVNGVTFKSIYGVQLFISLRKYGLTEDLIFKTELNYYMNQLYFKVDSSEIFFIGFNLLQVILSVYFLNLVIQKNKKSEKPFI